MEAGIEHLGRSTARGVDLLIVIVEPGQRSLDTATRIKSMADDIGLKKIKYVANKIMKTSDEKFIRNALPEKDLLGIIPYSEEIRAFDRDEISILDALSEDLFKCFEDILDNIKKT